MTKKIEDNNKLQEQEYSEDNIKLVVRIRPPTLVLAKNNTKEQHKESEDNTISQEQVQVTDEFKLQIKISKLQKPLRDLHLFWLHRFA